MTRNENDGLMNQTENVYCIIKNNDNEQTKENGSKTIFWVDSNDKLCVISRSVAQQIGFDRYQVTPHTHSCTEMTSVNNTVP